MICVLSILGQLRKQDLLSILVKKRSQYFIKRMLPVPKAGSINLCNPGNNFLQEENAAQASFFFSRTKSNKIRECLIPNCLIAFRTIFNCLTKVSS